MIQITYQDRKTVRLLRSMLLQVHHSIHKNPPLLNQFNLVYTLPEQPGTQQTKWNKFFNAKLTVVYLIIKIPYYPERSLPYSHKGQYCYPRYHTLTAMSSWRKRRCNSAIRSSCLPWRCCCWRCSRCSSSFSSRSCRHLASCCSSLMARCSTSPNTRARAVSFVSHRVSSTATSCATTVLLSVPISATETQQCNPRLPQWNAETYMYLLRLS